MKEQEKAKRAGKLPQPLIKQNQLAVLPHQSMRQQQQSMHHNHSMPQTPFQDNYPPHDNYPPYGFSPEVTSMSSFDSFGPRGAPNVFNTNRPRLPLSSEFDRFSGGMPQIGQTHVSQQFPAHSTIYQVQFKTAFRYFVLGSQFLNHIQVTDFVIVEADRGEDLGVVTALMTTQEYMSMRQKLPTPEKANNLQVRRIIRVATLSERQSLAQKHQEEQAIVQFCGQLVSSVHQLPIVVFDAEYQFDRNKLIIYYNALSRFDFRELVRDLFAAYKARIWMEKFYPPPGVLNEAASMALATGVSLPVVEQNYY